MGIVTVGCASNADARERARSRTPCGRTCGRAWGQTPQPDYGPSLPERVTYYRVPHAGHTESWNVGPFVYEARVREFLRKSLQIGP